MADLTPEQHLILKMLPRDSELHIDQLLGSCPLEQPKLNEALMHLEMMGLVRRWPGGGPATVSVAGWTETDLEKS